jgi:hypothetical protein
VINVLLNLFFVIGLKMDVAGVALATTTSQCVSAFLIIRCLMKESGPFRLTLKNLKPEGKLIRRILRIGIPASLEGVVFSLSNVVLQSAVNSFGSITMAGCASAASIEGFVWVAMNAFSQGALTFTSQNIGGAKIAVPRERAFANNARAFAYERLRLFKHSGKIQTAVFTEGCRFYEIPENAHGLIAEFVACVKAGLHFGWDNFMLGRVRV